MNAATIPNQALVELAEQRAGAARFLSGQLLHAPVEASVGGEHGALDDLRACWRDVGLALDPGIGARLMAYLEGAVCTAGALRREYNALFSVAGEAFLAPFESVYRPGHAGGGAGARLRGEAWTAVTARYRRAGYAVNSGRTVEADHLGCELEFLAALCSEERAAWLDGDTSRAMDARRATADFLEAHPRRWAGDVAERVAEDPRFPYYRAVLALVRTFLEAEATHLAGDGSGA